MMRRGGQNRATSSPAGAFAVNNLLTAAAYHGSPAPPGRAREYRVPIARATSPIHGPDPVDDSPEQRLCRHLGTLAECSADYFAVHVQLSRIGSRSRTEGLKGVAARPLHRVASLHDATAFTLGNLDVVLICRNTPVEVIDRALEEVRRVIPDSALGEGDAALLAGSLAIWYDLSEAEEFERFGAEIGAMARNRHRTAAVPRQPGERPGSRVADSRDLITLRRHLAEVAIADLIRRQTAIRIVPGAQPAPLFRESYVSMADLRARLNCDVDLVGTPWLFQSLSDILDKRVIAVAQSGELFLDDLAISLNLNQRSLASRELRALVSRCDARGQRLLCEISLADVLNDTALFGRNRDMLRAGGHGIIVDGVAPKVLRYLDFSALDPDFVKLTWGGDGREGNEDLADEATGQLREEIGRQGASRFILARVDSEAAVGWAATLGIQRFQGFFIDRVVTAMRSKKLI